MRMNVIISFLKTKAKAKMIMIFNIKLTVIRLRVRISVKRVIEINLQILNVRKKNV